MFKLASNGQRAPLTFVLGVPLSGYALVSLNVGPGLYWWVSANRPRASYKHLWYM